MGRIAIFRIQAQVSCLNLWPSRASLLINPYRCQSFSFSVDAEKAQLVLFGVGAVRIGPSFYSFRCYLCMTECSQRLGLTAFVHH
jgi:hypothetical protein